ncbi:unnamed protein product [Lactuca saligna]|uniref:Helitron helicase-like domain-containing protein n=1 Tax=Lactuca saligna TaxID=75948 RepID=A0AA35ZEA7_LACSI|nr:unnamed protein product [Lactuca saligna]
MYAPRKRLCRHGGPSTVAGDAASTSVVPYVQIAHATRRGRRPGRMRLPFFLRPTLIVVPFFWFSERSMKLSTRNHPRYSRCCRSGEVILSYPSTFPSEYMALFRNNSFMRNIRAYNSMFSMTSFGATVDDEVNHGRGPYVFKKNLLDEGVIRFLVSFLSENNEYVQTFKTAKQFVDEMNIPSYSVRLFNDIVDRRYDLPTPGSLGCIVTGDTADGDRYDIVIHSSTGRPQHISNLHPTYMPLHYPLLFPYGEPGWCPTMKLGNRTNDGAKNLTVNMYYAYHLHERQYIWSAILNSSRLFQQYLVDAFTCIEDSRLPFYATHQETLHSEYVGGLYDALSKGDRESRAVGKRVFLPASFTGGPRYMYSHYQDALAICRVHGNPQYFITFTCNVKWPEITQYMDMHDQRDPQSRAYIIARVFQAETELPDPLLEPQLYATTTTFMIHEGYVRYKHGPDAQHTKSCGIIIHNGYVVPYNKKLCSRFEAHINVEYCGWNMMIKYLFKYISKGTDRVRYIIQKDVGVNDAGPSNIVNEQLDVICQEKQRIDEIKTYLDGRYICPHEAAWRIFDFPIHHRNPAVQDPTGHQHTYIEYPKYYKWDGPSKSWDRRAAVSSNMVCGLVFVHPSSGELVYLRSACNALGIIGDDIEWLVAFNDAFTWATPFQLRLLFCSLLLFCEVTDPNLLWQKAYEKMSDDYIYILKSTLPDKAFSATDDVVRQQLLHDLEDTLCSSIPARSLTHFNLPMPSPVMHTILQNQLLLEEMTYNKRVLADQHAQLLPQLNTQQRQSMEMLFPV